MSAATWQSFGTIACTCDAFVLSVLSKRSYAWDVFGRTLPLEEQAPLASDAELATRDDRNAEVLTQGSDVWPLKLGTDVIVSGHARVPGGALARQLAVGVDVGSVQRELLALGPRFVRYRGRGNLAFSEPQPFSELELSWWNAYGGIDPFVLPQGLADTPVFAGEAVVELLPGAYPRNPCGLGYLVQETPALLDGLSLPLLERPAQRLSPETLLLGDPRGWGQQPAPAGFGWCHSLWFPRLVQGGAQPYHLPLARAGGALLRELELGRLDEAQLTDRAARCLEPRWANEAAPDMVLPFLRGDEALRLRGFDVLGTQAFQLPNERPEVTARVDGVELASHATVPHTLAIDADRKQFYLLWSTRFVLPEAFGADFSAGEPLAELHSRCQVRVGERLLEPEHWPAEAE